MLFRSLTVLALALAVATAPLGAAEVLPLAEVRPGMEGTGRTVFQGAEVEEFGVRILGVLDNAVGPRQSLILARLDGGPLAETGVIQGMSGSPVFIDGKLVGAVAYSFPFGKEPIAGITPFAEMVEATRVETPRAPSARFRSILDHGGLSAPLDRDAIAAAFERPLRAVVPGPFRGESLPASLSGAALQPLSLPLVFSGFDASAFEWARGLFASLGFAPVLGAGASSSAALGPLPDLEPGGAVGVSLIEGDLDLSATGTITHIDRDRVYAFGHPFYNLGPTRFPMKKAYVYSIFPSLQTSWKISAVLDEVGTVDQDRATAIAGRIGAGPRMISTSVALSSEHGGDRTFRFRMVEDELFTPLLAYMSFLSVIQGHERAFGTATLRLDARIALEDGREVLLSDIVAADQPAPKAAGLLAGPLTLLVTNRFEEVTVESLEVTVKADEANRSARIVRAWVEPEGDRIRPGTEATLKVLLRTHRGELETQTLAVPIPKSAPAGSYGLLVADAATLNAVEKREMRQPFVPRDLDQLVRRLNQLRSGHRVYARLTRPDRGAIVGGEYLPALPPSVLSVMRSPDQGTSVVPLATRAVWSGQIETDHAVSGARRLKLTVEP
jgi:hypothetical protein